MPKSALIMTCPLCGAVGDHNVQKTLPQVRALPLHEAVTSRRHTGQEAGYRVRVRCCTNCRVGFETVEMPRETFNAFLEEFAELRAERRKIQHEFETLRSIVTTLDVTVGTKAKRQKAAERKARGAEEKKKRQ